MPQRKRAGRPRQRLPEPAHSLTRRVRCLVDVAHGGNVWEATRLTGVSYPTLSDLYVGRTTSPSLATLKALGAPYGVDLNWLTDAGVPEPPAVTGRVGLLPPPPGADARRRALRKVDIPFTAWPMYEVFALLERRLGDEPAQQDRAIVGEATGDAFVFRLTTFLLQPLLAAERVGEVEVIPAQGGAGDERWVETLRALGRMWRTALPHLLSIGPAAAGAISNG